MKTVILNCAYCNKPVEKPVSYEQENKKSFCNRSCATTYKNLHYEYPKSNDVDRFWKYVNKKGNDDCWEWVGSLKPEGYGQLQVGGHLVYAHRYSWQIHFGYVPLKGIQVHHKCDNRKCVNPNHLWLGVQKENIADMIAKGRQDWSKALYGENHPMSKLCNEEVEAIRLLFSTGKYTATMLAVMFGINQAHVGRILDGKSWKKF